jgi:hypothetical protein
MGLEAVIAGAVEAVRLSTETIQVQVQIEPWIGEPLAFGGPPQYGPLVLAQALVQEGLQHTKRSDGTYITTRARLSFLDPAAVPPNGAPGRREPIDPRDIVTLPSGLTGHLQELPGVQINPATGQPYVRVVGIE